MQKKILSLVVIFICSTFALLAQTITDGGYYYLRNRDTGKFLTGGNNWGTNLCLHETGIDFRVNKTDNGYTFYSGVGITKNNEERYYLSSSGCIDAANGQSGHYIFFDITNIDNKYFTIKDNSDDSKGYLYATGKQGQEEVGFEDTDEIKESHQWEFLTKADLIEELQGATTAKPMNATFFISGFNFNRYDNRNDENWIGTKTITGGTQIGTAKFWCARLDGNGDVYQELEDLPTGYYELTAYACSNGGNAKIYAGNTEKAITNVGTNIPDDNTAAAQAFADGNYKTETIVVLVTNGTLKIGVKNTDGADTDKTYFDNFNLKYHGNRDTYDYYLRNVATGKFLRAGKRFGTQAIQDDWGLNLTFKMNADGKYSINTRVGTSGNYLGSNGFVDGGETFYEMTEVSANKYTIKIVNGNYLTTNTENDVISFTGTVNTDTKAQWELVTREQLIQELKYSKASDTNPKDATFFIQSPNLGQKDQRNNNDNWKGIDFGSSEYGGLIEQGNDKLTNLVIQKLNNNFDTYQTITGLPSGVYELEVQAFYNQSGEDIIRPFVYAKLQDGTVIGQAPIMSNIDNVQSEDYTNYDNLGDKTEFKSSAVDGGYVPTTLKAAALAILNGYYKADAKTGFNKIRFVVTEDNATVQIGVKKNKLTTNDWTVFDNFKLTYLGEPKNGETQTKYGLEIGEYTYYLKNYDNGRYLNGGNGGNTATLGYLMNENSTYTGDNYNKGVRETEFKFSVIEDDKILIQTDFGNNGYLVKDGSNAKLDGEKDYLRIRWNETNKTFYIICEANSKEYFLRNSDALGFGTSSGTTPGRNFQWVFQTKEDLLNEFSDATADNPVDATFLLRGTSFHNYDNRNSAWDAPNSTLGEEYHNATNKNKTFNISQLLQDAPVGVYEFGLQGAYSNSSNAKYYVYTDGKLYTGEISNSSNLQSHNVIRFKKSDNDIIIVGAYNNTATENATIYIDNVRLTYLGTEVNSFTSETTIAKGIKHKHSHYYDIAIINSHATVGTQTNNQIITVTDNQTTMSDSAMVKHVSGRMVQNTPVYYETIYAKDGEEIELVIPSSHPNKTSSRNFYYQRFYDYETDGLFDEATKGTFRFDNLDNRGNILHSDATIRDRMRIYEGTKDAPAGGWVIGTRWGQQVIAKFYFTPKFTGNKPIYIGLDHSEYTDVGDMGLFGDLTEPTLAQRVVYKIMPASVMAEKLEECTEENFLEVKSISFPTIWHGLNKNDDLNVVALDMQIRNYFTDANNVPKAADFTISLDDGGTGITLATTKFSGNTERFIKFNYPEGGEVKNYTKTAYIKVTSGGKNIAKFILDFVPNTELRPWGDIIGKEDMPRSPSYLDKNAIPQGTINFDKRYYDNNNTLIPHAETWPVGFESGINGVEENRPVAKPDAFNPYPLDFAQTSFSIHYPNANFGQYSVMKYMYIPDYTKVNTSLKDVNQLYHDFYKNKQNNEQQMERYTGDGYFMYIDASHFPSSVAELTINEQLCANTTIHVSGWVTSMDISNHHRGNKAGYLILTIVGKKKDGTEEAEAIESFCPGPIRADAMSYDGHVKVENGYNQNIIEWGTDSRSIWQQFAFSFVIKEEVANEYTSYALKIDNYCPETMGGDMLLDDVRLYIQKAVPNIMQTAPLCDAANMDNVKIYTDFTTLINAVGLTEAEKEEDAEKTYKGYLPSAWYCFLDKKIYDATLKTTGKTQEDAFNEALIRTGGNNGAGYYKFDFSSCFISNDGSEGLIYNAQKDDELKRIYLTPAASQLTAGETSLKNMAYYIKRDGNWHSEIPVWNVGTGNSVQVVYGHNDAGDPTRYTDLGGYEELRIYQTEGNRVRCFFLDKNNTISKNIADGYTNLITKPEGCDYWKVDLNAIKAHDDFGQAKLIGIKSANMNGDNAIVSNITLYKSSALELNKPYYILFHATKEEPVINNPATFFNISNEKCAPLAEFNVSAGTMVRFDGTMSTEDNDFCENQIATIKAEMQGINNNSVEVKVDLFYDWWNGDRTSYTAKLPDKEYSAKDVRDMFRKEYPDATIYNDEPAKGEFTVDHAASLKELLAPKGKLYLYQAALNVKVVNSGDNMMNVVVIPVDNQIESYEGYCNDPMEISLRVNSKAPTALDGFKKATYPDYMQEVPLRIGLEQIKEVTADASNEKALFIPLRQVALSGTGGYSTISVQKKSDADNFAAVYLAETNDPEMISYNKVNDNLEMRFVGKMHTIVKSAEDKNYEDYVQLTFNSDFKPKEGYRYTLKTSFIEQDASSNTNTCNGDLLIPMYIVPEYQVWTGGAGNNDWTNDRNWRRADNSELNNGETKYTDAGRLTNEQNTTSNGLVPMNFTNVLMQTADGTGNTYSSLSAIEAKSDGILDLTSSITHTTDIEYHLAADRQEPTVTGWSPNDNQVYCVPFYTNTCDEINFAPSSQMLNTHLLNYNKAWVEYALESKRWYALSSPLQGVVSGDMYLPRNTAKQNTAYFYDINYDNTNYSRLKPAVYQQAWDKAEATIYRLERDQLINKTPPGLESETATANVARVFNWSKEYNDVKVPFGINGFSVRVDVTDIDGYNKEEGKRDVLLRLPKADNTYNYYMGDDETNGSKTADLTTLRNNAGKLFTDNIGTDGSMTVTLTNNSNDNEYYLVGNPFMSALDLDKFFDKDYNPSLDGTYWILTSSSYTTGVKDETQNWLSTDVASTGDIAPLQAFFVRKTDDKGGELKVIFTKDMAVAATGDVLMTRSTASHTPTLRITAMRNGMTSSALVACRDNANSGFKHGEDAEALFDSHLADAPTVFTMSGDKAAAINVRKSLNGVPLGIESNDDSAVSLTFNGVENFSEELYLYDLLEDKSTPIISSGSTVSISGKNVGRYYLVTSDLSGGSIATTPVISIDGKSVSIVSPAEDMTSITVNDVAGRRVYSDVNVGNSTEFELHQGIYIINVETAKQQVKEKILIK
ncbi:MAG: T9SS type A sorting domain-containing protein [Prevotella sp.]|nr:T9SS type A sorting domain-containing protein [Prevotella sp.]